MNLRRYYLKICKIGVKGIFDYIKYSLYLNWKLFICYNFGYFKIKSLSWEGKSLTIIKRIYEINWILNIIRVDSRRYDVKKNYQRQIGHVHNSFMEKAKRQYAQKVIAQWHFTLKRGCYGFVNSTTTSICCLIISNVKFDIK